MPYAADRRKLYKVGVSFSSETGTINDFGYELAHWTKIAAERI